MNTELIWITPHAEQLLAKMARVSNPANQDNPNIAGLIKYMWQNQHYSPFEMVSACFEIETTRDIARQILRHRSFSFQEFSQRYADISVLPPVELRECRMQDTKNRQSSLPTSDKELIQWFEYAQDVVWNTTNDLYDQALAKGIAKEQARCLLPEGLTASRLYMTGTLRSWLHYCQLRTDAATQKEHRLIAQEIANTLGELLPITWASLK
jgi:thymidylate synthase (FAD)